MTNRPDVLTKVETSPAILSQQELDILRIGAPIEETVEGIEMACRSTCALGREACKLEVSLGRDAVMAVTASCAECPNPSQVQLAVNLLFDFADRRIAAINDVVISVVESPEAKAEDEDTFFHLVEDPEKGDFHVISWESLKSLQSEDTAGMATRVLNSLYRNGIANNDRYSRVFIESMKLKAELGSRTPHFIVAEGMNALMESELQALPYFGKQVIALLERAHQKVIEAGIAQEELPRDLQDTLLEELELGVRSYNCLKRAGVENLGMLVGFSEQKLQAIPNFGQKQIEEVKEELQRLGLQLSTDEQED